MSGADWVILAVILVSIVHAATQGFFHEAFTVAGLVLGYLLAAWQYPRLAAWFAPYLKSPWVGEITSFLIIFLAVMFLAAVAGRIARWTMREAGLRFFDRVLGGVFGLLRGGLMVAVILMGMAAFTPTSKWLGDSQWAPYFLVVGRAAIWLAPSEMRARFYQGLDILHRAQQPPAPPKPASH